MTASAHRRIRTSGVGSPGCRCREHVAAALADAFVSDPVFMWLLPGRLRRQSRLRLMFAAELEQYVVPNGTVWTTASAALG
jgi:hypothetical protein